MLSFRRHNSSVSFVATLVATIVVTNVVALFNSTYADAAAYGHSRVGLELEYEAKYPSKRNEDVRNHQTLLGFARHEFGGSKIKVATWDKYSNAQGTSMAAFKDPQGRVWSVVPEKMNGEVFDGFELITPPLDSPEDTEKFGRVISEIKKSGEFRAGVSSSTHFTYDVSHLVGKIEGDLQFEKRNIAEFVDVILFLESNIKSFYSLVEPARYGHIVNKFAVPMAVNQKELLQELAAIPREQRTFGRVRDLFKRYDKKEAALFQGQDVHAWKYRAFNYAKLFGLGRFSGWRLPVVEARMSDLIDDSVQLEFVGRLFARAISVGAKTPTTEFRDPFPDVKSFVADSEGHATLDAFVRAEPAGRTEGFLRKLGMAKPSVVVRCEALFSSMEQ
ncbi:hypothetical protein BH10BDE1_BH10BDE1_10550 [soil metagenome]